MRGRYNEAEIANADKMQNKLWQASRKAEASALVSPKTGQGHGFSVPMTFFGATYTGKFQIKTLIVLRKVSQFKIIFAQNCARSLFLSHCFHFSETFFW